MISQEYAVTETNNVLTYDGDFGIVVGFGTDEKDTGEKQFIFDLHIPSNSPLRNTKLVDNEITISSLDVGDYFTISKSSIGSEGLSITSLDENGNSISTESSFVDNTYKVDTVESVEVPIKVDSDGVSTESALCRRVYVNVNESISGFSDIQISNQFATFSWGKVTLDGRSKSISYPVNTILQRTKQLKYKNYIA